ncbi:hypothetical protein FRC09_006852 [Ceratobasidium sp. 395]|nr:hypothetical protein FRC09_006852 [Ceratobasidium sp. 395]
MSNTPNQPSCVICGGRVDPGQAMQQGGYPQLCRVCIPAVSGASSYTPGATAIHLGTEPAIALLLSAATGARTPRNIEVDVYQENGATRRVPKVSSFLGEHFFSIPARCSIVPGEVLNNPYQVCFQVVHPGGFTPLPNLAVHHLTGGTSRYPWRGDILILKFNGRREERYISTGGWESDIGNIQYFFVNETIRSQEGN